MQFVFGAEVLQVLVAGEDLVCALAGQDDLDVPGGELGEYVVRYGATHQRGVEALDGTDHRGQNPERVFSRVDALVVLGIQILGDGTGCQEVGRILEAHGEGLEPPTTLPVPAGGDGGDEAGVEAAGEEDADGHVAHHLPVDRSYESVADLAQDILRDGGAGLGRSFEGFQFLFRRDRFPELDEATLGAPVVARREGRDVGLPFFVEGAHLRGEADEAVTVRPVQRLYAHGVAGRQEGAVFSGDQEREHAKELGEGVGATLGDQTQCHLVVRARLQVAVLQSLPDLLVVVDFAVAHEIEVAVRRDERLPAALYIDDGETPVADHVPRYLYLPLVVRSPVGNAPQHARGGLGIHASVGADDSAHVSPFFSGVREPGHGRCYPRSPYLSMLPKDNHISYRSAYISPPGLYSGSADGSRIALPVPRTVAWDHAERRRLWRRSLRGYSPAARDLMARCPASPPWLL